MRILLIRAAASLGVLEAYSAAVPQAETSAQLAALGVALGSLTAVVYLYRDEFSKRLDRIERRLDSLVQEVVRWANA